ncbi:MAG: NAD(P)/FAD-dependent oxidoreductase [Acidiferrobacterales bacterium]|nr:NAD(P)/FAD-dependent oxidoreductase [Acidiferrobacterales bacterium]
MKINTESVIVGAGPCGLFQIFELGLLGIKCHIVDSLSMTGGQCSTLYADKPIYDIPGYPVVGGQELVDLLVKQASPFEPEYVLGEQVTGVLKRDDGRFDVTTSSGTEFDAGTIVIAGGLGAFDARPLRTPGAAQHAGQNLNYHVSDKNKYRGKRVAILGGGDSALDWALELHGIASSVVVVHRRQEFRAQPASVVQMKKIADSDSGSMSYHIARIERILEDSGQLSGIRIVTFSDDPQTIDIEFDELLVFYGLSPNLGPIAQWGLQLDRKTITVDTENSQTSEAGIFAIGDIASYPGKKKLILCGFHEAAMAAFGVQHYLYPEIKQRVQFTTTSPIMHERLKVDGEL